MKIKFKVKGHKELNRKLSVITRHMKRPKPLYQSFGLVVLKWIKLNYRSGGGKLSTGKWKKLTELTRQGRRKRSNVPMLNTGHLLRQWTSKSTNRFVRIGNPSDVALFHEKGTDPYDIFPVKKKFLWFGVTPAQRTRGQKLGGHLKHVAGKFPSKFGKGKTPGVFSRGVHHPGLPVRRQLPNEMEIMPDLIKVADVWLKKIIKRRS